MSRIERRKFIKYLGGLTGLVLLGKYVGIPYALTGATDESEEKTREQSEKEFAEQVIDGFGTEVDTENRFAMVIDSGACIGCRRCMFACKEENNTPDTISPLWIEAFELESGVTVSGHPSLEDLKERNAASYTQSPKEGKWYLTVHCNHCANPPCVKVCPTGATYKDKDGLVPMNYEICIGCRMCVVACPYSARRFNWFKPELPANDVNPLVPARLVGVVEKCTFCVHRVRRGKLPRCVEVCPVQAKHFGKLNDPESGVSRILRSSMSSVLLEEANTEPHVWYITRGKKWVGP